MTVESQTLKYSPIVQRSPIFYGWVVWFVASIGLWATAPGQSFSVSLFIDHYIADFGLDRTTVSGLYGLGTFLAALSLTWVGKQIDRRGNRRMSIIITLLFAIALIGCSLIAGPFTLLLSFIAIRGLGQGSLGLVSLTAVAQWFQRRRGFVVGLSLVGFAIIQRFYLPWIQAFIEANGWRTTWILMGLITGVAVLPVLGIFLRDRPEAFGLVPDGKAAPLPEGQTPAHEENWLLSEALRTPVFWAFNSARFLSGAWGTALVFHQISLFEGLGHTATVAATTFGQAALMTAGFTLVSGWLVDRLRPGYLVALQMLGLIGASGLALIMTTAPLLLIYAAIFGLFMGVGSVFDGSVWVTLFGRAHQGAIRGFVATSMVVGTAFGPLVFGLAYDYLGSYEAALWLGIVLALAAAGASLWVKLPTRSEAPAL
ncbi:MAG: MFS transporter [Chloroflexi bacterium]|nr:MFS transporter [Chloroflexota bacterium]